MLIESNTLQCQEVKFLVAVRVCAFGFPPLAHKTSDEQVRGDHTVAWNSWSERVIEYRRTNWYEWEDKSGLSPGLNYRVPDRGDPESNVSATC